MSARTEERRLYERGDWYARIPLAAWWEVRKRQRYEDAGMDLRSAEIARLAAEQARDEWRPHRQMPQVIRNQAVLSLDGRVPHCERTLGEVLGA
jgi:hypothetical protein